LIADALNCPHFDSRLRLTKNLRLPKLARVRVRFDHIVSFIVNANHRIGVGNHHRKSQQSRLELGCISAIDSNGRTIWIADAHRGDGKRFVVRADEKLTVFGPPYKSRPNGNSSEIAQRRGNVCAG
jgi:hypothetical protein